MPKLFDVTATTGSYEVAGEKKYRTVQVGSILEKDGRQYMLMNRTFNPAGVPVRDPADDTILLSLWEPKPRDGQQAAPAQRQAPAQSGGVDFDDDVPFN